MSALKLEPQEKYAPKYLRIYYHGYTPELYKEIVNLWRKCKSIDVKRKTALEYAKRAQEKDLENKKEAELSKYRGYTFITFEDGWQKYFKNEEDFVNEIKKHLKALILHLVSNFKYASKDVEIIIKGYNPHTNIPDTSLTDWKLDELYAELQRGNIKTYSSVAKDIWYILMHNDDHNIQKRTIEGWKIYGDNSGKRFYIDFLYDPCLPELIKQERELRAEEYKKNHPTPDDMGYGGGPGHYTGD